MKNDYEICGDTTQILMQERNGQRLVALIDTADLELAQTVAGAWHGIFHPHSQTWYVRCSPNRLHDMVLLHRLLLTPPDGLVVDHINHDGLDNRRQNLRVATLSVNARNRRAQSSAHGTYFDKRTSRWAATIRRNGYRRFLGRFPTQAEAHEAYLRAVAASDADRMQASGVVVG